MKKVAKNPVDKIVTNKFLKEHLDEVFEKYFVKIKEYIDFKVKPLEDMSIDYYTFKDHVTKTLDWLVGAYQKFDEEYIIMASTHSKMQDILENHEKRIVIIENKELGKKNSN